MSNKMKYTYIFKCLFITIIIIVIIFYPWSHQVNLCRPTLCLVYIIYIYIYLYRYIVIYIIRRYRNVCSHTVSVVFVSLPFGKKIVLNNCKSFVIQLRQRFFCSVRNDGYFIICMFLITRVNSFHCRSYISRTFSLFKALYGYAEH